MTSTDPSAAAPTDPQTTENTQDTQESQDTQNAAPKPNSQLPPPAAPEPEGPRAANLREIFNRALGNTLKKSSYQNFASCFPTPAKRNPKLLEALWRQMNTYWETHSKKEFEKILVERNVVPNLNELDRLIEEAKERKRVAPPESIPVTVSSLRPEQIVAAHLAPLYEEATPKLQEEIDTIGKENAEMVEEIRRQREEMRAIMASLEKAVGDLEGMRRVLGDAAGGIPEDALA